MRIIKLILLVFIFTSQFFITNNSQADFTWERIFIVTAYYSPLPNQKQYSYSTYYNRYRTFEEEKTLQWEGHTTASWKPVAAGLLAWPKNYPFGTKIYFEWFWVWAIEDRWWAIVNAWVRWHEYDRIDIWMWYGDEWLMRAKKWWSRTVKWKIVDSSSQITLKFWEDILEGYENLKVNPDNKDPIEVKLLQELFTKLWLYDWKLDWRYSSIEDVLIKFQIESKAISWVNAPDAWYYWPKTVVAILKKYGSTPLIKEERNPELIEISEKVKIILEFWDLTLDWDNPEKENVEKIQELFTKLELYSWEIDWNYDSIKNYIISFQKTAWLIRDEESWWAWHIWDKTKEALLKHFEEVNRDIIYRKLLEEEKEKYNLDNKEIDILRAFNRKLEQYIKSKSRWNMLKEIQLVNSLKEQIANLSEKTKSKQAKSKLQYIHDNLISYSKKEILPL